MRPKRDEQGLANLCHNSGHLSASRTVHGMNNCRCLRLKAKQFHKFEYQGDFLPYI